MSTPNEIDEAVRVSEPVELLPQWRRPTIAIVPLQVTLGGGSVTTDGGGGASLTI